MKKEKKHARIADNTRVFFWSNLHPCRLENERDRASVEAGTLRRQIAALQTENDRTAQVCVVSLVSCPSLEEALNVAWLLRKKKNSKERG